MTKTIEEQKEIARKVMFQLEIIDPTCILAGGAPRDWYFGNPANDLDFYFRTPTGEGRERGISEVEFMLTRATGVGIAPVDRGRIEEWNEAEEKDRNDYKKISGVERVFECKVNGQECQFIQTCIPTMNITKKFSTSLSDVYWKRGRNGNHPVCSPDFLWAEKLKMAFVRCDKADNKSLMKMKERFPEYFYTKIQVKDFYVLIKELVGRSPVSTNNLQTRKLSFEVYKYSKDRGLLV